MNPDQPSRGEIEAKLTALLLGELPDEEARLLRWAIAQDVELAQLHDRLKVTIGLLREVTVKPTESVPLKLSDERRKRLLAHFKTPRPKESFWLKRIKVPSLITALVLVAIVALLAAMLLPALSKAKSRSSHMTLSSGKKGPDLKFRTWSGDNSDREEMAASAPPASAPTTVTLAPEPVLAPPPVQIILPSAESPSPVTAVTGSLADSGNGGVYSQNIVGSVNAWNGAALLPAPATPHVPATATTTIPAHGMVETFDQLRSEEHTSELQSPC